MFHRLNGVASRGTRGPAAAPALAKTDVPRRARVAAIVVSVASTWLTLSSAGIPARGPARRWRSVRAPLWQGAATGRW